VEQSSLKSSSLLAATISQLSTLLVAVLLPPPDSSPPPPPGIATPGFKLGSGSAHDVTPVGLHDVGHDPGAAESDAGVDFPWLVATRRAYTMPEFCQASGEDERLEDSLADLAAVMSFPTSPEAHTSSGSFMLSLDTISQQERDQLWRLTLERLAEELGSKRESDAGAMGLALFATDLLLRAAKASKDSCDDPYVRRWFAAVSQPEHGPVVKLLMRVERMSEGGVGGAARRAALLEGLETVVANVMGFLGEAGEWGRVDEDERYAAAVATFEESLVQVVSPVSLRIFLPRSNVLRTWPMQTCFVRTSNSNLKNGLKLGKPHRVEITGTNPT